MTDLKNRERIQVEAHLRSLDQQILDALLRIEEILDRAFPDPRVQAVAAPADGVNTKPGGMTIMGRKGRK
jgi:hypothetical protein